MSVKFKCISRPSHVYDVDDDINKYEYKDLIVITFNKEIKVSKLVNLVDDELNCISCVFFDSFIGGGCHDFSCLHSSDKGDIRGFYEVQFTLFPGGIYKSLYNKNKINSYINQYKNSENELLIININY